MDANNLKDESKIMINIWLEQYKQCNDYIRNYRSTHWQIASVLYVLMMGTVGYGLPHVEGCGKYIVCFSSLLIFILHCTTYTYFQKLQQIQKNYRKKIEIKIKHIKRNYYGDFFLNDNGEEYNKVMCCWFFRNHPLIGFIIIFASLFLFALAFMRFPANKDAPGGVSPKPIMTLNSTQNSPTIHIEILSATPNNEKVNPKVTVDGKEVQPQ